jgi:hypothetical protein
LAGQDRGVLVQLVEEPVVDDNPTGRRPAETAERIPAAETTLTEKLTIAV